MQVGNISRLREDQKDEVAELRDADDRLSSSMILTEEEGK